MKRFIGLRVELCSSMCPLRCFAEMRRATVRPIAHLVIIDTKLSCGYCTVHPLLFIKRALRRHESKVSNNP